MADERLPVATGLCNTCRFWFDGHSDYEAIAECRRMPPTRIETPQTAQINDFEERTFTGLGGWPITGRFDSCGEYSARKEGVRHIWDMGE